MEKLTVPATDFEDMKVFALNLDNPKSQTYRHKFEMRSSNQYG